MKKIRTLVTSYGPEHWTADRRRELPNEVELAFLENGQKLSDALPGAEVLYGILPERGIRVNRRLPPNGSRESV